MKKLLLSAAMVFSANAAYCDTILGIYVGAGVWNGGLDGGVGADTSPVTTDELGIDSQNNTYLYIALEHPVPMIPNIKLAHTDVSSAGDALIDREFTLDSVTFTANAETSTDVELTHTDATFYYEILDNWVSLDLGLTARSLDGYANISANPVDDTVADQSEEVELKGIVPMGYAKAQFDLPFSGWYFGGHINYITVDGDKFSDIDAKIGYMTDGLGLDFGIDLGFRQMKVNVDELDDLNADLTIDGPYASAVLHF